MLLFVILLHSLSRSIVKYTKIFYETCKILKMHRQLYFISSTEQSKQSGRHMLPATFTTKNTLILKCVSTIRSNFGYRRNDWNKQFVRIIMFALKRWVIKFINVKIFRSFVCIFFRTLSPFINIRVKYLYTSSICAYFVLKAIKRFPTAPKAFKIYLDAFRKTPWKLCTPTHCILYDMPTVVIVSTCAYVWLIYYIRHNYR